MRNLIFVSLLIFGGSLYSQDQKINFDTLNHSLTYKGKDIYVRNPFGKGEDAFSVKEVWINDEKQLCETNASAFMIDLSKYKLNEEILIQIVHTKDSKPNFLGPKN